jgi:sulfur-oxidizing protein SoxY
MTLSRRDALQVGLGGLAAAVLSHPVLAATVDELAAAFTGGAATTDGGVTITAPEIAENGNTVPISVSAPGATAIMLLATGNPEPALCTYNFGTAAGSQTAVTRIRLAKTQEVIALARMADGSIARASQEIKVTIGGCGG